MYIRIAQEETGQLAVQATIVIGRAGNNTTKSLLEKLKKERAGVHIIHRPLATNPAPSNEYIQALRCAIEEAVERNYESVAIPVAPAAFTDLPEKNIPEVVVNALNGANDCLLKTLMTCHGDDNLNEIVLVATDDTIAEQLDTKLSQKRRWSKARMLSFVLDALNLQFNQTALCKRHFIHGGHFKRYLNSFSRECRKELEEKYKHLLLQRYEAHGPAILEIWELMKRLRTVIQEVPFSKVTRYISDTKPVLCHEKPRFVDSLVEFSEYCDPLFHYIKHLIPDEEFNKMKYTNQSFLSRRATSDRDEVCKDKVPKSGRNWKRPMRSKQEVKNQYAHLESRIRKIMELQDTVFPLHLLEDFWNQWIWTKIMSHDRKDPSIMAKEVLCNLYNVRIATIESQLYREEN